MSNSPFGDQTHLDDTFTYEKYLKVKKAMMEGEAPGPENIPSDVFKRCEIDDIIMLNLDNKLLINIRTIYYHQDARRSVEFEFNQISSALL